MRQLASPRDPQQPAPKANHAQPSQQKWQVDGARAEQKANQARETDNDRPYSEKSGE
jgi:hypothetical protein